MDMKQHVVDLMDAKRERMKEDARLLGLALRSVINSKADIEYDAVIYNYWSSEGGKDSEAHGTDINKVLEQVSTFFKRLNSRSDIQGKLNVIAKLGGISIKLDDFLFESVKAENGSIIGFRLKEDEQCVRMADESTD